MIYSSYCKLIILNLNLKAIFVNLQKLNKMNYFLFLLIFITASSTNLLSQNFVKEPPTQELFNLNTKFPILDLSIIPKGISAALRTNIKPSPVSSSLSIVFHNLSLL